MRPRHKELADQPWLEIINGRQAKVDLGGSDYGILGMVRGQAMMVLLSAFEGLRAAWPEGELGEKRFTELMVELRAAPHTRQLRKTWHGLTELYSSAIVSWQLSESIRGVGLKVPTNLARISNIKKRRRLLMALPTKVLARLFYAVVYFHERHSRHFRMEQSSSRKEELPNGQASD